MKARLEALERIVSELQSKPAEEAVSLLQRIRSVDDIVSVSNSSQSSATDSDFGTVSLSAPTPAPSTTASFSVDSASVTTVTKSQGSTASSCLENTSLIAGTNSSVQAVEELGPPSLMRANASAYLIRLIIPSAQATRGAIQSFYSSAGKLFHVFTKQQTEQFYKMVFGPDGRPNISQKVAICCLSAVAAVGIQYNPGDFDPGSECVFYDVARHYFVDVVEERPLDAIKVCCMLAMFNVMDKATVAIAYLGRHHVLFLLPLALGSLTTRGRGWVEHVASTQAEYASLPPHIAHFGPMERVSEDMENPDILHNVSDMLLLVSTPTNILY